MNVYYIYASPKKTPTSVQFSFFVKWRPPLLSLCKILTAHYYTMQSVYWLRSCSWVLLIAEVFKPIWVCEKSFALSTYHNLSNSHGDASSVCLKQGWPSQLSQGEFIMTERRWEDGGSVTNRTTLIDGKQEVVDFEKPLQFRVASEEEPIHRNKRPCTCFRVQREN